MTPRSKNILTILATAAGAVALYYSLPGDMNELSRRTCTIFFVAAVFWATEVMPLYATSLCIIGLEILFLANKGGLATVLPPFSAWPVDPATGKELLLDAKFFMGPFSSTVIMLFMGGFLLSAAVTKHGLDHVIAAKLLRPFNGSPMRLLMGILIISAFFSMWMSNTATAAMMLAIIAPIVKQLPAEDRFHRGLILAVPFGANIGGIGTPIGTPPNAVALAALRKAGFEVGFLDWMVFSIPLAVLLLIVAGGLLWMFNTPEKSLKMPTFQSDAKISGQGKMTLAILGLTIGLWLTSQWHGLSDAAVALLAAAALTALRVLDKHDVNSIDWNVLVLMWGGLSLGDAMNKTGFVDYIVHLSFIEKINSLPPEVASVALAAFIIAISIFLANIMSHTATAALIVPMAMAMSADQPARMAILCALASSFGMAMPVSTPPNAIAFATGKIPVSAMIRAGGLIAVISFFIMMLGYNIMLPSGLLQ